MGANDPASSTRANPDQTNASLSPQVRELLGTDWELKPGRPWTAAIPPANGGVAIRAQGWKLHLSATAQSVGPVLDRVVPILRVRHVPFKFAADVGAVRKLGSRECGRAEAGKVITIYPADDLQAKELAAALHAATRGFPGPRILSDRPYLPHSLVHYRYGGFHGVTELDNDGVIRYLLRMPDGSTVPDQREAWYEPPAWAMNPFDPQVPSASPPPSASQVPSAQTTSAPRTPSSEGASKSGAKAVLLGGRYLVRKAFRHSTKGGVYAATDRVTNATVVVKHARAHAETDELGGDARTRLLHEAAMLHRVAEIGLAPRPTQVFASDGDLFLVEEFVDAKPLRHWAKEHSSEDFGVPASLALPMARRLLDAVVNLHQAGLVFRDLSPMNVLVKDNGELAFIDLESVSPAGTMTRRMGTPGYQAPELCSRPGRAEMRRADPAEDLYSLGGLLFLLATGNDPVLPASDDGEQGEAGRLGTWLALAARFGEAARILAPAALALIAPAPAARCSISTALALLESRVRHPICLTGSPLPNTRELLGDSIGHLVAAMRPDGERLWPTEGFAAQTDPRNVQHGAAGVLAMLLHTGQYEAARDAADWLAQRCPPPGPVLNGSTHNGSTHNGSTLHARHQKLLPGLYFGAAGPAWALADAGYLLDEPRHLERAKDLALALPLEWPNPDVAHGLAGATLTHLRIADHTGDTRLFDRVSFYAKELTNAAVRDKHGPCWPIPANFDSRLAGASHYGFAHGVSGIGYALLASGLVLDVNSYVDLASEVGAMLCRVAQVDDNGAAWWPVGPNDPARLPHWCSGSSGVGTFLIRLFAHTGEQRFAEYARAAAGAVHHSRWQSSGAACHGLSGDGQFLLDVADQLDDPTYRAWAEDFVPLMAVRHGVRDGRRLVPDETNVGLAPDYNTGLAGVAAYLHRLHRGGPRPFMLDDALSDPDRWPNDWTVRW